ncbi:MAG: cephalosporin hydroxylase family protein [Crocinitomicaceae bacterium]|nr:cephalosporin hydroxylase family protein [Crocinitomicaceae bacterium]
MNENEKFEQDVIQRVNKQGKDAELKELADKWVEKSMQKKYVYNFSWLGRPIIQYPEDIMALQEIIWKVKPDLIIETGIAHGGSIIFSASMLKILGGDRKVIGIDIDIREHNRTEIENHPVSDIITMVEGSSIAEETIAKVKAMAEGYEKVMVILDSMHTHDHVLAELNGYSSLVSKDSYLVVLDTFVEDMPVDFFEDRPWNVGNNPKTAVWEFIEENKDFVIDKSVHEKLLITVGPDGYLKRIN